MLNLHFNFKCFIFAGVEYNGINLVCCMASIIDLDEVAKEVQRRLNAKERKKQVPIELIKRVFNSQVIGTSKAMSEFRPARWNKIGAFKITPYKRGLAALRIELAQTGIIGDKWKEIVKNYVREYMSNKYGEKWANKVLAKNEKEQ